MLSPNQVDPTVDGCEIHKPHHEMKPWLKPLRILVFTEESSRVSERWCEMDFETIHSMVSNPVPNAN